VLANCSRVTDLSLLPSTCGLDAAGFVFALAQVKALEHLRALQRVSIAKMALGGSAVRSILGQLCDSDDASCNEPGSRAGIVALDLSANNLNRSAAGIFEELRQPRFATLLELRLCGNWIGASGAIELRSVAAVLPSLRVLNLQSCCLDRAGAAQLAGAMQHWPQLEELYLCNNFFAFRAIQELRPALSAARQLTVLDLGRNALGNAGMTILSGALQHCTSLRELALERCSMDDGCADVLAAALKHFPDLLTLRLGDNSFSPIGMRSMAGAIHSLVHLKEVHLRHNGIRDEGFRILTQALSSCRGLSLLDVGSNNMSGDSTAYLGNLHPRCNLVSWNNRMNAIGGVGMSHAGVWLATQGSQLTHLQISWNSLDELGCDALLVAIPHMHNLQQLLMVGNVVGDDACKRLVVGLLASPAAATLDTLDLSWNNLSDDSEGALKAAIRGLSALTTLRIASNFISPPAQRRLLLTGTQRDPPLLNMTMPL
jgi:Ran GTPase-activating protein (RanGAP) involved in mRNA processing and transport